MSLFGVADPVWLEGAGMAPGRKRYSAIGPAKSWCRLWAMAKLDPLTDYGSGPLKVLSCRAARCQLFGRLYSWWPVWKVVAIVGPRQ